VDGVFFFKFLLTVEWWWADVGVKDERSWMKITEAAIYVALRLRMGMCSGNIPLCCYDYVVFSQQRSIGIRVEGSFLWLLLISSILRITP
jgi:hypothetical protein